MEKKKGAPIIALLITIVMAYSVMPVVSRFFSEYLTTYTYLFVVLITLAIALLSKGASSITKYIGIIIPFIIWQILVISTSERAITTLLFGGLLEFVPIILGAFIVDNFSYKGIRYLSFVILILFVITSVTTIVGLQIYPDASRYLATVPDINAEENIRYNFMNIGGYNFVYMLTLIYPLLIYGYKKRKIHLFFVLLGGILTFIVIVNAGYTTALLLFIVSTVFLFFSRKLRISHVVIITIISLIVIYALSDIISSGLNSLADIIENKDISMRLRLLAEGREGLTSGEDDRLSLYMMSIRTFLKHPILGRLLMDETLMIGGHSFILDFMADFGIVGLAIIVVMYRVIYVRFFKPYKDKEGFGYVFWLFIQPIILSTVNTNMWIFVLCLYIPVVLAYIDKKEVKNENFMDSKLCS